MIIFITQITNINGDWNTAAEASKSFGQQQTLAVVTPERAQQLFTEAQKALTLIQRRFSNEKLAAGSSVGRVNDLWVNLLNFWQALVNNGEPRKDSTTQRMLQQHQEARRQMGQLMSRMNFMNRPGSRAKNVGAFAGMAGGAAAGAIGMAKAKKTLPTKTATTTKETQTEAAQHASESHPSIHEPQKTPVSSSQSTPTSPATRPPHAITSSVPQTKSFQTTPKQSSTRILQPMHSTHSSSFQTRSSYSVSQAHPNSSMTQYRSKSMPQAPQSSTRSYSQSMSAATPKTRTRTNEEVITLLESRRGKPFTSRQKEILTKRLQAARARLAQRK